MKVIRLFWFTILLLLLHASPEAAAQTKSFISGRIIDSQTHSPVPFATVILKNSKLGVFANADGDFIVPEDAKFGSDSLIITCIGYYRKSLPYSQLLPRQPNTILLIPNTYSLKEVKVLANHRDPDPKTLVRKAIRNINKNYPLKPYSYISYYRDYQKRGRDYLNLNEAIVRVSENGFRIRSVQNGYTLLGFRKNDEFPREYVVPYYDRVNKFIPEANLPDQGGNELLILMVHDALRNHNVNSFSFINAFVVDFLNNHTLNDISPVFNDNMLLYKISFVADRRLTGDSLKLGGDIYIEPRTFGIHKLDYSGYYNTKKEQGREMFNITVEYGSDNPNDKLLYLKYISFNNIFRITDMSDTTYFRAYSSYTLKGDNSTVYIDFNHPVNRESALDKRHYNVWFNEKPADIKDVFVNDKQVILKLDPKSSVEGSCAVKVTGISDNQGNLLDEKRSVEYYQFREMFVQEYDYYIAPPDSCYIKNIPLQQNCIYNSGTTGRYWMNTPVRNNSPGK